MTTAGVEAGGATGNTPAARRRTALQRRPLISVCEQRSHPSTIEDAQACLYFSQYVFARGVLLFMPSLLSETKAVDVSAFPAPASAAAVHTGSHSAHDS
jgi:hypothetical protein